VIVSLSLAWALAAWCVVLWMFFRRADERTREQALREELQDLLQEQHDHIQDMHAFSRSLLKELDRPEQDPADWWK
jgi:hypothetical protein